MRRLVPLLAVLFALAAGIALGAGPLHEVPGAASTHPSARRPAAVALDADVLGAAAPTLYGRRLADQPVTILAAPGVRQATVDALTREIGAAGGTVATSARLTEALTAPGQKTLVDTLGTQLAGQLRSQVPALADGALTTYPRMGRLLGVAVATTGTAAPAEAVSTVRDSLRAARLTTDLGSAPATGLVLLLVGDDLDDAIVSGLVAGLAAQAHGVVVAGPSRDGDLAALAQEGEGQDGQGKGVATVDGTETAGGRTATVLALIHQVQGGDGSFGASGIDGPIPLG